MESPQNLGGKIKYYFSICCISFTILELVLSTLNATIDLMSSNMWINNIEMFVVCFCIAFLMFATDTITRNLNKPLAIAVHWIEVAIPVFGLGGLAFHWFSMDRSMLIVFGIMTFVYFAVCGVMLLSDRITANMINKKILERKGEHKNDREDN